ncbi:hypothetical protein ACHAXR_010134 [Thalassiosira sp. AJA248-18]
MEIPPSNPFSGSNGNGDDGDDNPTFDAFALGSPVANVTSSPMPSLQSIHQQEQMQQQQQQQLPHQQLKFDSLPSPEELQGPMNDTSNNNNNWPPAAAAATNNAGYNSQAAAASNYNNANNNNNNGNNNQSFLSRILTCGGICSIEVLRPYFDVDTADILVRMKGSLQYCMVNDGFRNEVLYSDNAMRLAYRETAAAAVEGGDNTAAGAGAGEATTKATASPPPLPALTPTSSSSSGKGPDLYGPIWITLTLVFFVAVTSNMSLYIHHHHQTKNKSIVDEGGIAAEQEWDYDINQLLHATWILYSFSMGLPTMLYFVLRLVGVNNLGLAELICLYGYSLAPYLPVTWICIIPYGWVQWPLLAVATVLSGMLVLRNVVGPILDCNGGGGGGLQGKSGGLIMCLVACHFVFFLVMKVVFYHHS